MSYGTFKAALFATLRQLAEIVAPPPPVCTLCHRRTHLHPDWPCARCQKAIVWATRPWCQTCGRPLISAVGLCADCRRHPHWFACGRAVGPHEGLLRQAVHDLKYSGQRALARPLGTLLAALVMAEPGLQVADVVVPVPLAAERLARRGFNQAALLAEEMARKLRLPLLPAACERIRDTAAQSRLSGADRRRNLAGAFVAAEPARVRGRTVLVVDDVMATGGTLDAVATALLRAGATSVVAVYVTLSVPDGDLLPRPAGEEVAGWLRN